jgi:hypothetical protein
MGRVDVYNLGAGGVNAVDSPIHLKDGTLTTAQNVQKTLAREGGGISKRNGQDILVDVGAGPVLSIHNVALVPPPLLDPETGSEIDPGDEMRCRATKSADQSIPNNTLTTVTFDTEDFDLGPLHDTVTNNSRFTVPVGGDGIYLIIAQASWTGRAGSGGRLGAYVYKNGVTRLGIQEETPDGATGDGNLGTSFSATAGVALVAGDYIEMKVQQNTGGAFNLLGAATDLTSLFICRLFASA